MSSLLLSRSARMPIGSFITTPYPLIITPFLSPTP
jgi:hypothetical protein